jgi:hypothetical protein
MKKKVVERFFFFFFFFFIKHFSKKKKKKKKKSSREGRKKFQNRTTANEIAIKRRNIHENDRFLIKIDAFSAVESVKPPMRTELRKKILEKLGENRKKAPKNACIIQMHANNSKYTFESHNSQIKQFKIYRFSEDSYRFSQLLLYSSFFFFLCQ